MSAAFDKGRDTEREVASILRRKLGARVRRDKRSGAGVQKADISDYYGDTPLFIECKDQQTIKIKEWMRQARQGASIGQIATLVFRMDNELLATVSFEDLANLLTEIRDLRTEIAELRKPQIIAHTADTLAPTTADHIGKLGAAVSKQIEKGTEACKNGHIVDTNGYCLDKKCPYARGYKAPKLKAGRS